MPHTTPTENAPATDLITGHWPSGLVTFAGNTLSPEHSLKIVNHSPTGFAWGYAGSGPAQLAIAILLELGIAPAQVMPIYQDFEREMIAPLPLADFTLPIADARAWLADRRP